MPFSNISTARGILLSLLFRLFFRFFFKLKAIKLYKRNDIKRKKQKYKKN